MKSISIVIQARLSSTRLPGKVLKPFFLDQTILSIQVSALKKLNLPIILATTTNQTDDLLVDFATKHQIECYRGSESDVLSRFIEATDSNYIIRVCSDNPFLDISSIDSFLQALTTETDYVSFQNKEGIPAIKTHWGLFTELVSKQALCKANELTENNSEKDFFREHVTNYIYGNPNKFEVKLLKAPPVVIDRNDLRFTVDTAEDFTNMQYLYALLEQHNWDRSLSSLVDLTSESPEVMQIMKLGIERFTK